jgi:hypothetical protein
MKFFERDLCERLVELGCIPVDTNNYEMHNTNCKRNRRGDFKCKHYNFYLYDFIAPTEQARRNSKKIVGEDRHFFNPDFCKFCGAKNFITNNLADYCYKTFRSELILAAVEKEAEQMIRKAVGL